ncbi:MAG TPA: DUF1573 domain-containing protein [Thermoanaerobaculia bacterium]|nr:DUF1573 domain-containing protein [Thermoanaerobaculia bacterium]
MRRSFFIAAVILASAVAGGAPLPPKADVQPAERDLGTVPADDVAAAEFTVENRGGAPLTVEANPVREARVTIDRSPVPPGESAAIRVEVGTAQRTGPSSLTVELKTNDPERPVIPLKVALDVHAWVLADPGYARYNFVEGGRAGVIREVAFAVDDAPFRVTGVDSPYPSLAVRWRPAAPAERLPERSGSQWVIELTLSPYAPVGPLGAEVVVHLDHPRQRQLMIPVSGFVRPMLAVTPPEGDLGDLDDRPVTARFHVRSFAEDPVALESAKCDIPGSAAEIRTIEPGRVWQVVLTIPAGAPGSLVTGSLRLETTSPTQPEIEVPVRGQFRAK